MSVSSAHTPQSMSRGQAASPYPPSWLNRFTAWVERLPGPAWLFYLLAAALIALLYTAAKWFDGAYPVGAFFPLHIIAVITSVAHLAMIHYTSVTARQALDKFQPVLAPNTVDFAELSYRLATNPARTVWLMTLIGLVYGMFAVIGTVRGMFLQSLAPTFSGPITMWTDGATGIFICLMMVLAINHIYTKYTRIDLFNLVPLYALSQLTARAAISWMMIGSLWLIVTPNVLAVFEDAILFYTYLLVSVIGAITFIWPLLGIHSRLETEKEKTIAEANQRLKTAIAEFHELVDHQRHQEVGPLLQTINGLKQELEVLNKIPTWPWQSETLRTVSTAVLLPIVVWLVQTLLSPLLTL
jgi:hypothetical protein